MSYRCSKCVPVIFDSRCFTWRTVVGTIIFPAHPLPVSPSSGNPFPVLKRGVYILGTSSLPTELRTSPVHVCIYIYIYVYIYIYTNRWFLPESIPGPLVPKPFREFFRVYQPLPHPRATHPRIRKPSWRVCNPEAYPVTHMTRLRIINLSFAPR